MRKREFALINGLRRRKVSVFERSTLGVLWDTEVGRRGMVVFIHQTVASSPRLSIVHLHFATYVAVEVYRDHAY